MKTTQKNFFDQLATIYDAESQLLDTLDQWIGSCDYPNKEAMLKSLHHETEGHVCALGYVFLSFRESPQRQTCDHVAELIRSHNRCARRFNPDTSEREAALELVVGRIRNYKAGVYSILYQWSRILKNERAAAYLFELLDEEKCACGRIPSIYKRRLVPPIHAREHGQFAMHM